LFIAIAFLWSLYSCGAAYLVQVRWLSHGDIKLPLYVYFLIVVGCVAMSAVFFMAKKPKVIIAGLLGVFFTVSLILTGIWYGCATYTLRDESIALRKEGIPGTYIVGMMGHQLAVENELLPIYAPWWPDVWMRMNKWFDKTSDNVSFLMIKVDDYDGLPSTEYGSWGLKEFPAERLKNLGEIKLCPIAFTKAFRFRGILFLVHPQSTNHNSVETTEEND